MRKYFVELTCCLTNLGPSQRHWGMCFALNNDASWEADTGDMCQAVVMQAALVLAARLLLEPVLPWSSCFAICCMHEMQLPCIRHAYQHRHYTINTLTMVPRAGVMTALLWMWKVMFK